MRVLFDLVHPADALFFHHPIRLLRSAGAEIRIASRRKDVLIPLLDALGHEHEAVSQAGSGRIGLAVELVQRDWRLLRLAQSFRPDAMVGFGGVAIAHVGAVTGIPSLSFYDTEHAALQVNLALPFIREWHVPRSWRGPTAKGRTFYFNGGKQSAYLHPDHFVASPEIAAAAGWVAGRDNFLIRTVAWQANHDHGRRGISPEQLGTIVSRLAVRGQVHISAEGELPPALEPFRYRGGPAALHHLLAHCRAYVGESITVASEAVMLGVPAVLQIDKDYGYVAEQEEAGLIHRFGPEDFDAALARALAEDPIDFQRRARGFVAAMDDINLYVANAIQRAARQHEAGRAARVQEAAAAMRGACE